MAQSVSIGALRYDVIADTVQFEKGLTATRKELRQAEKAFRSSLTPAEKYRHQVQRLAEMHRKGLIDSKTYTAALKKEKAALKSLEVQGRQTSKAYGMLRKAAGAAAVYFSARGAANIIGGEMERVDEIAKASRKLGMLTDDLVGIRLAGEQMAGMMDSTVDMALQRMTRRVAEAAAGTGEAKDAIAELGLDAKSLNDADPGTAFMAIAEAMKGVESESDRLRLAFKLFDSEGASLVNVLANGADGIEEMTEKARELGLTFSDETAAQIEEANDALSDMKAQFTGVVNEITVALIPAIKSLTKLLDGLQERFRRIYSIQHWQQWMFGRSDRIIGDSPGTMARPSVSPVAATGNGGITFGKPHSYQTSPDPELERVVKATLQSIPSFAGASRGEYEFLRNEQQRKREAAETKRLREQALAKQQAQIDAINALPMAIAEAVDNTEGV